MMRLFELVLSFLVLSSSALAASGKLVKEARPYTASDPKQKMCLGAAKGKRFPVKEISWPKSVGEAEICLWKGDKYAALSLTIDDNCKPDHEWWLKHCERLGFKVTWFVVTGGVKPRSSFNGDWPDWIKLHQAGHGVQSHTIHHHKDDDKRSDAEVRQEYGGSKATLEDKVPGNACVTAAYPCGRGKAGISAEYFIAARGTRGTPNPANSINYKNVNASSRFGVDYVNSILGEPATKVKWLNNSSYKRGWMVGLYHFVHAGRTPEQKAANAKKTLENLEYAASKKDRIWIDTFENVARYGQERDSAKLTVSKSSADQITLTLTDQMRDDLFNFPLTIKICVPRAWKSIKAKQGDARIRAKLVEHQGKSYALVDAVPDRGEIRVKE